MARVINYERMLVDWPYSYCRIADPMERKQLLDLAIEKGIDPAGNELRLMLWKRRHPDAKKQSAKGKIVVDIFIRSWMNLDIISGKLKSKLIRNKLIKDTKKQLEVFGREELEAYGELGKQIFYEEMFQLVYAYMRICEEDRNYGTVVLGLGRLPKQDYANKVAQNIYRVCHKVPLGLDMQEEFAVLQKAAKEAYYDMFPGYWGIYDKVLVTGVK